MARDWIEDLRDQLVRHEGVVLHAYQDHLGFWTIGIGRLIDKRRGGGLTRMEAEHLLMNDITRVVDELSQKIPFWSRLPASKRQALGNMAFQLGVNGLLNFRRMLASMSREDWESAEREALQSKWAEQTPKRAREIAAMIGEK
jgi:lysozyme